jgi:hypothetical protein
MILWGTSSLRPAHAEASQVKNEYHKPHHTISEPEPAPAISSFPSLLTPSQSHSCPTYPSTYLATPLTYRSPTNQACRLTPNLRDLDTHLIMLHLLHPVQDYFPFFLVHRIICHTSVLLSPYCPLLPHCTVLNRCLQISSCFKFLFAFHPFIPLLC